MGTRELLILILGLAVVAVILRGLYVALNARRRQIRLAIDKNIPQDLDLEELEMSELPNGGARVVQRSLDAVNQQNTIQNELDLGIQSGTEEAVPILLDTVEIRNRDESQIEKHDAESGEDDDADVGELTGKTIVASANPDDLLVEDDSFEDEFSAEDASLTDDNNQAGSFEDELVDAEVEQTRLESTQLEDSHFEESHFEESHVEESNSEGNWPEGAGLEDVHVIGEGTRMDEEYIENEAVAEEPIGYGDDDEDRQEPEIGFDEAMDDDLDDFSMSAGERIGAPEQPAAGVSRFRTRFNSNGSREEQDKGRSKARLFSRFSKKETVAGTDDEPLDLQSDPLFEGYDQADKPVEKELSAAEVTSHEKESTIEQAIERIAEKAPAREPEKGDVADINQARESRRPASSGTVRDGGNPQPTEPTEVLVVNVMSREGELFHGPELLQVMITAGLKHGDMNIFHKHVDGHAENPAVFSVANILNPGTFDLDAIEEFTTRGVSLFLAMPSVISNRDAFEDMLRTAQQIRAALDGELRDDHRSVMTAQTIEHYRQRIHDYELRKLKAAQARS